MAENIIKSTGFDRSQIEEIKARISIEDVISRYVRLKPSGKNLFGLCPFHKEDTPSFSVNQELQIFKCFGCGEGGDVFTFLQKIENLEFPEVLEKLAQEAGIELKYSKRDPQQTQTYVIAKEIHTISSDFYQKILSKHPIGEPGRKYLSTRKLTKEAIAEFKIGYAPKSRPNNLLIKFLEKSGYNKKDLIGFGLAVERNGQIVDKFADRIVFPIMDSSGKTIGFSGRILTKEENRPKYLNSPETIIFKKRSNLFGFYQAKQEIRKNKFSILVEGQTDVISSWQMGIKNIVAPLGTGVTGEQLDKLKKITPNLTLAFDSDSAGLRAIMRTSIIALEKSMNVSAAQILYGNDADECIKKDPKLWTKTIKNNIPVVSFFLDLITEKYSPQSLKGKKIIIEKIGPIMKSLRDEVTKDHHIKEISTLTGINQEILRETFSEETQIINTRILENIDRSSHEISTETYLLTLVVQYHNELKDQLETLNPDIVRDEDIKEVLKKTTGKKFSQKNIDLSEISDSLEENSSSILKDSVMRPLWMEKPPTKIIVKEFKNTITKLEIVATKIDLALLKDRLFKAEERENTKESNEILNQVNKKIAELDKLTRS